MFVIKMREIKANFATPILLSLALVFISTDSSNCKDVEPGVSESRPNIVTLDLLHITTIFKC